MGFRVNVINWLLEDDSPGVEYLARTSLLGEDPQSRKLKSLAWRRNEYPPVAKMLDRIDEAMTAGNYAKYGGAYWTFIFLAQMNADGRDPRLRRLAEHVLTTQKLRDLLVNQLVAIRAYRFVRPDAKAWAQAVEARPAGMSAARFSALNKRQWLDDSLNGKMLADIERKGRPSKWITLRAMLVLRHFGRAR